MNSATQSRPSDPFQIGSLTISAEEIEKLLHHVKSDPSSVHAVWHPLGFMYIELDKSASRSVRLHVWSPLPGNYCSAGFTIHRHSWSLASLVLCGAIENRIYSVHEGCPPLTHRLYSIEYHGITNYLIATNREASCSQIEVRRVEKGEIYSLPAGVFHSAKTDKADVTATFVVAQDAPAVTTEILGPLEGQKRYLTQRRRCDQGAISATIELVLNAAFSQRRGPSRSR